ncbi:MAG: cell division protein FtsZ [Paludibacteraceae bacterium]|nr:cell division protein FtsZ [Paludibacteraceae bacterium]
MTEIIPLPLDLEAESIIKVMGVGGGGGNAVNHMYKMGIRDVSFLVCNTDRIALGQSSVPSKLQLGPGLGAGGKPERARELANENRDRIREALNDGTKMLFITAGMGGGTGTGASPIVAEVAQEMEILTVGIVTIPFAFEGKPKIRKALVGVAELAEHVDALLVINNEKLCKIFPDLDLPNAFDKSDDVVSNAAKSIAEIITVPGYINTDFADVYNTLKKGGVAIMNVGQASGEERITKAIRNALESPLVNTNDVRGASRVLLQFYCSHENAIRMNEFSQITAFVEQVGDEVEVQWGASYDDTLGDDVRVTIIATGYSVSDIPGINAIPVEITNQPQPEEEPKVTGQPETLEDAMERFYPVEPESSDITEAPEDLDNPESSDTPEDSETPVQLAPQPNVVKSDVMDFIDFDDDDALAGAEEQPAWMRRR